MDRNMPTVADSTAKMYAATAMSQTLSFSMMILMVIDMLCSIFGTQFRTE